MAKVKDGKIVKDDKKEKTNFLGGKKSFSIKKGKTLKEQRSDIIKGRADRLKSDAKKQGISVDELNKKRSDTFSTVLSPLTLAPIGRGLSLAGKVGSKVSKFLKGSNKIKKSSKVADKVKNVKTPSTSTSGAKFSQKITKNKKTIQKTKKEKQSAVLGARKQKQTAAKKIEKKPSVITNTKNFIKRNKKPIGVGLGAAALGSTLLSGNKSNKDKKASTLPKTKLRPENIKPKDTKPKILKSKPIKKTNITAGGNTGFGAKGNVFVSSEKRRKELMDKFGGTGSAAAKAAMKGTQGSMVTRASSGLKPVPEGNKGLGKLPSPVRNKMGYMKKGGIVKMRGGGAATRGMNFNRGR